MAKTNTGLGKPPRVRAVHPVPGKVDAPPQTAVAQFAAEPVPGNSDAPSHVRAVHPVPGKVDAP
jgi:hypothetical protein